MKYKTLGIFALATFITCVLVAFGSSTASVVLLLYNPTQQEQVSTFYKIVTEG